MVERSRNALRALILRLPRWDNRKLSYFISVIAETTIDELNAVKFMKDVENVLFVTSNETLIKVGTINVQVLSTKICFVYINLI